MRSKQTPSLGGKIISYLLMQCLDDETDEPTFTTRDHKTKTTKHDTQLNQDMLTFLVIHSQDCKEFIKTPQSF